jgi:hypothetical protein
MVTYPSAYQVKCCLTYCCELSILEITELRVDFLRGRKEEASVRRGNTQKAGGPR